MTDIKTPRNLKLTLNDYPIYETDCIFLTGQMAEINDTPRYLLNREIYSTINDDEKNKTYICFKHSSPRGYTAFPKIENFSLLISSNVDEIINFYGKEMGTHELLCDAGIIDCGV